MPYTFGTVDVTTTSFSWHTQLFPSTVTSFTFLCWLFQVYADVKKALDDLQLWYFLASCFCFCYDYYVFVMNTICWHDCRYLILDNMTLNVLLYVNVGILCIKTMCYFAIFTIFKSMNILKMVHIQINW